MARGKPMRNPNGYGSVVTLSGKRRKKYEVRVNTRMDERNYPTFDVLGRFEDRATAMMALAEYNKSPYDINSSKLTFSEVYEMWFDWKYLKSNKKYSDSTIRCSKGAYDKCKVLHKMKINDITSDDMQNIIDDYSLSHAYMEHIKNLFRQVFKYAMKYNIVKKDYSEYIEITKEEDDECGVPFTKEDIATLWKNVDKIPYCDTVLILIYTGWRITEFMELETSNIDMENCTMTGGIKTDAGKKRIVPIHSGIKDIFMRYYNESNKFYLKSDFKENYHMSKPTYYGIFKNVLKECGIMDKHTPHDCRHTFTSLLDTAGANDVCIDRLVGHASKTLTKRTYTHKDIEELREAVELIKIEHPI